MLYYAIRVLFWSMSAFVIGLFIGIINHEYFIGLCEAFSDWLLNH